MRSQGRTWGATLVVSLLGAALLLTAACSDDTDQQQDSGVPDVGAADTGGPDTTADTGAADAVPDMLPDAAPDVGPDTGPDAALTDAVPDAPTEVILSGKLVDFVTAAAVPGVDVCVDGVASVPCVKTDAVGIFTLTQVPNTQDVMISMKKTGYQSYAVPHGAGQVEKNYSLSQLSDTIVAVLLGAVGTAPVSGKGHIILSAVGNKVDGVTFTGTVPGQGPYYLAGTGFPDTNLTATSVFGIGFYVNVDPGEYEVTFTSGATCALSLGWAGSAADKTKIKVLADTATAVNISCN